MGYVCNPSTNLFTSMDKQDITGNGGASYTLSHAVANANEIEVYVNNVRQEPNVAYTTNGTALNMTGNVASSDDFYVVYQGKAVGAIVPPDGSVGTAKLANSAVTDAKITAMAASKLTGALPALDGSALTGITSVVKYFGTSELAQDNSLTTTSTTYVATGATITIPAATVATLSKIIIVNNCAMRVDKSSHSHVDIRVQRTAPSAANFAGVRVGDVAAGSKSYVNGTTIAIDSSLGTGDHTYAVYVRKAAANPSYAANIYYNHEGHRMIAVGV